MIPKLLFELLRRDKLQKKGLKLREDLPEYDLLIVVFVRYFCQVLFDDDRDLLHDSRTLNE